MSGTDAGLLETHGWAAIAARHASGHAPSRTVTQSSSFLSSKNPNVHRVRMSTGRTLAASPTLRRVAKEMTASPRQNLSRVVLMFRAMSRRVTSSAHTWVGRGAAVVVAAPRAMSQCTGRTVGGYAAQLLCQAEGGYDASQRPRLLAHGGAPDEVPGQCPRCVQLGPVRREPAHIPEDRGPTLHGTRGPPPDGQREELLHVIAPP